ncbi:MAG: LPS export ABC transporter ATP-binding protein [Desulfobacterales bacterium]|nr:LPS export ABC transporter ATP-binding protein [Desulfobacterales bacterium]
MAVLSAKDLVKIYKRKRVVDSVSLEVKSGSVVGLLGPNGAGKTTTFYTIVGLVRPDEGNVFLNGDDITSYPMYVRARKGIGYLPQESCIFRKLTVEENILAILETMPIPRPERYTRLNGLLEELNIGHLARRKAYALSGGERRRVEITRALVTAPSFILLDEPFAGIDPIALIDIQKIIGQLKERGIGVVISDHNVRETLGVCDRAYILNDGVIIESGPPEAIVSSDVAREIYLGKRFRM